MRRSMADGDVPPQFDQPVDQQVIASLMAGNGPGQTPQHAEPTGQLPPQLMSAIGGAGSANPIGGVAAAGAGGAQPPPTVTNNNPTIIQPPPVAPPPVGTGGDKISG